MSILAPFMSILAPCASYTDLLGVSVFLFSVQIKF